MKHLFALLILCSVAGAVNAGSVYTMQLKLDKADGYYQSGETAICTALLLKNGKPADGETLRCTVKEEMVVKSRQDVVCNGKPLIFKTSMERPGWVLFSFSIIGKDGKALSGLTVFRHRKKPTVVGEIGAMFDKDKIIAKPNRPADFDEFWENQLAELAKVPLDPVIKEEKVHRRYAKKVKCYSIQVKCLGRSPVTGYMAVPINAKPKSLPVIIDFLSMVRADADKNRACYNAAAANAVALYISWHGMETGHPKKWYPRNINKWYKLRNGIEQKGKWIMHDMFLRTARSCDFAKSLKEWNGKDLIIRGGSLGGIQAIAATALVPEVSLAIIGVSAGCEMNANVSGRSCGWVFRTYPELLKSPAAVANMAYYDGVNFAPRIKCETYVSAGFSDERCFPSNIIAFYNAIPKTTKKYLSTAPQGGHYGLTRNKEAESRVAKGLNSVYVH